MSIEADLELATRTLPGPGRLFFAGGPKSHGVQVFDPSVQGDPLMARLGDIFQPRGGRHARYRTTHLQAEGPAHAPEFLEALREASGYTGAPLVVYVAAHGDRGPSPRDSVVALWAGTLLEVPELARILELPEVVRPAAFVMSSCFSGGFAEIVFSEAHEGLGPAPHESCGLFASTWDEPSSGCDPNPNRRAHEGFGVHFLHALRGQDRHATPLLSEQVDFDADGVVSLLDAHTRVRIASRALEIPTTTSERWLRAAAPASGAEMQWDLPHERAVVQALEAQLGSTGAEAAARAAEEWDDKVDAAAKEVEQAKLDEDAAYFRLAGELLARWPVLDDPWHPSFPGLIQTERQALEHFFGHSAAYAAYERAVQSADRAAEAHDSLRLQAAPVRRLARAWENMALARRLAAHGGAPWERFLRLRACESARVGRSIR